MDLDRSEVVERQYEEGSDRLSRFIRRTKADSRAAFSNMQAAYRHWDTSSSQGRFDGYTFQLDPKSLARVTFSHCPSTNAQYKTYSTAQIMRCLLTYHMGRLS